MKLKHNIGKYQQNQKLVLREDKTDEHLARHIKKKQDRTQITNIRKEKEKLQVTLQK